MRIALAAALCAVTTAFAADPKVADKDAPSDAAVIGMCGGRLAKVFHDFGTPVNVFVIRGNKLADDSVALDFGTFSLNVRNKTVVSCFFFKEWSGAIKGIKIGDSREQVIKVLGDKFGASKNKEGVDDVSYDIKDNDALFWVDFDKDNKVVKVEIQLK
jgi:hypothetical protein